METITHGEHVFEIVDRVPYGYMIWSIGTNMLDGYLPLCRLSAYQPFVGGRNIDINSLKAIRIKEAQLILDAAHGGNTTLSDMENFIEKHEKAKPGTWSYAQVQKILKVLPVVRQIKWS